MTDAVAGSRSRVSSRWSSCRPDDLGVARALEEYLRRCERGERPSPEEFAAEYPQIQPALVEAVRGLQFIERAALSIESSATDAESLPRIAVSIAEPLGDFRLIREIGRGGMGVVYEAEQRSLGRKVALKILPLAGVLDPRQLQRFKNEALAAGQLDHPNIVDVYGVGCERGVHYYAMRLVEGITVADAIAGMQKQAATTTPHDTTRETAVVAALSTLKSHQPGDFFRTVAELGIQAAGALEHAHQVGIVHRDIKPSNLMLQCAAGSSSPRCPKLWVTDFGLARIESDATLTLTGDLLGTLRYMSPEQAEGSAAVLDHRTDIYSLGVTLYELATGQAAFAAADAAALFRNVMHSEPTPPRKLRPDIPPDVEKILLKAMAKAPEDRYGTARALAEDFERFVANRPVLARPPGLGKRVSRFLQRHKYATASIAAAALLALVGLAIGIAAVARARNEAVYQRDEAQHYRREADDSFRGAMNVLTELVTRSHGDVPANEESLSRLRDDQRAAAEEFLSRHVAQVHGDRESRMHAAIARVHLGRIRQAGLDLNGAAESYQQAVTAFESLVADFPDDVIARTELAIAYTIHGAFRYRRGENALATRAFDLADTQFEKSLTIDPYLRRTLSAAALFYGCCPDPACRDTALTRRLATRMLDLDVNDPVAWVYLGIADYRDEKYSEAIDKLEKSRDSPPATPSRTNYRIGSCFLAMAHAKAGNLDEARRYWTIAEKLTSQQSDVEDDFQVGLEAARVMKAASGYEK